MRALVLTALVALVALAPVRAPAAEVPIPPAPTRWVTDQAGLLSPGARARLDAQLEAYERATGHQVVVWIGETIGGAPLDDWAVRTFAAWKLGRKGQDDGLAIFVLAEDRLIAIEVGYGLEGSVPDAIASRLIREEMAPRLRAGQADAAIQAGVDGVLTAIEGKPFPGPGGTTTSEPPAQRPELGTGQLVLFGVLAVAFLILFITNPRLAMWLLWSIMARGGGHGGGGGGGGFSGGGGRSGGGGARGGW